MERETSRKRIREEAKPMLRADGLQKRTRRQKRESSDREVREMFDV